MIITPYASFARPGDTTAYAQGDLVANDVDAADVLPLRFGVSKLGHGSGRIVGARIFKDDETVTNANFILYLFDAAPAPTGGDNAAFAVATAANYLGQIALDASAGGLATATDLTDVVAASPALHFDLELTSDAGRVIFGLLTANAAYAPSANEVFKVWLHIEDDA